MREIRVAVLGTRGIPDVQGGVESHCQELYPRLVALGCRVTVYARKGYVDSNLRDYKGVGIIPLFIIRKKTLEAILHTLWGLIQIVINRKNFDLVHIHTIGPSILIPLGKIMGLCLVVTTQGPDYKRQKWGRFAKKVLRLGEWCAAEFASEVISVSRNIQNMLWQQYGRKSSYIPNGVFIQKKLPPGPTLDRHNISPGHYILAVGRFVPEKGFHDLIDSFKDIPADWNLVIVGEADHEDPYSSFLKEIATWDSRIIMTGFLKGNPLYEIFSNAGVFVIPSYHEGLPFVLLEAMSFGIPVLISDIPPHRELVNDQELFFHPGDKAVLRTKLDHFIKFPSDSAVTAHHLKFVKEEFNWDRIAQKTLSVYRKALEIE